MIDFIDRDPVEMQRFAKEVTKYYDEVNTLISAANRVVNGYVDELDDKCGEIADKFSEQVKTIYSQIDSYRDLANLLNKKAQSLIDARSSAHF